MKKPNVYCDMDGVLVDLLQGYREMVGVCLTEQKGKGDAKWEPALQIPDFWVELPKIEGAVELMQYFENNVPELNLYVLTAPQHLFEDCGVQKLKWLNKHAQVFDIQRAHVVKRERKPEFAVQPCGAPNILIDDYEKNINEWVEAGGIGIHHTDVQVTLQQLAQYY